MWHVPILFKAPRGKKSLSALSGAACATFLPEAFLRYAVGGVFHLDYVSQIVKLWVV